MTDKPEEVYEAADALNDAGYLSVIFSKDRSSRTRKAIVRCILAHIAPLVKRHLKREAGLATAVA